MGTMTATAKKDKEDVIFWAACRVIREKGFHQARMADIAKEAGISYGLVYHYFKNKSDLFDALIREWWRGLDELADSLAGLRLSVREKLSRVATYFFEQYEERPELVHLFVTELSRSTANLTPERLRPFKNMLHWTEDIIKEGQQSGVLRSDLKSRYLTFFFLGSVEALVSTMVLEDQPLRDEQHKRQLADAVLTMFFGGAEHKSP